MREHASLMHGRQHGTPTLSDAESRQHIGRKFGWKRVIEAHRGRSVNPLSIGPEVQRQFPDSVAAVEKYAAAYAVCRSDADRRAVRTLLDSHCSAVASRALADAGRWQIKEQRSAPGRSWG